MASGGAAPACAACKYQRRRCTPECPLAQYFPHDRPRAFRNAHRLFGVSNILKTLARAGPERHREAMHCIIFESQAWDVYPAQGCVPIILQLRHQVRQAQLRLHHLSARVQAYRAALGPLADDGDLSASSPAPPPLQPQTGNNNDIIVDHAYGGVPLLYGDDDQQLMLNTAAACDDGGIVASLQAPWTSISEPQQDHHQFLVDASQQQQYCSSIHPDSYDEMSYFVDNIDDEMPQESSTYGEFIREKGDESTQGGRCQCNDLKDHPAAS
ncbi:LOB domain-containing protein 27-like isoform X2 [Phragmites australis]|uniref:LOB domain-containing protein 27-like isoform X2 n=1 Tax=Phragmites australis TaxID=29695 RepID=UPI002D790011|nr:LOB domain-containing protein 27-like isoform X2 [Phragmites australis]